MPGKDGGDVAKEFKSDPVLQDVTLIFMSGLTSEKDKGVRNGAVYLPSRPCWRSTKWWKSGWRPPQPASGEQAKAKDPQDQCGTFQQRGTGFRRAK
jgi:hypothetical protein